MNRLCGYFCIVILIIVNMELNVLLFLSFWKFIWYQFLQKNLNRQVLLIERIGCLNVNFKFVFGVMYIQVGFFVDYFWGCMDNG